MKQIFMNKLFGYFGLICALVLSCENKQKDTVCDNENENVCSYEGFYYYSNEKNELGEMSDNYILIGFDSSKLNNDIVTCINSQDFLTDIADSNVVKYDNYRYKHVLAQLTNSKNCFEITSIIQCLQENDLVEYAHYTIQTDDCTNDIGESIGNECVNSYSSLFYVKVKDPDDLTGLNSIIHLTNAQIISQDQFMNNWFTVSADKNTMGDALHMANYFYETGLFHACEPDIIKLVVN